MFKIITTKKYNELVEESKNIKNEIERNEELLKSIKEETKYYKEIIKKYQAQLETITETKNTVFVEMLKNIIGKSNGAGY